ncbi:hypothetical protein [Jeotgalibacillus sp. JSM ZJ347]|uniref:hypothetical protein n=1 Tax=Jeotgalibacillus sp. JSM ZJ347 TaxID=3342117 RepID=UPI0035A99A4D
MKKEFDLTIIKADIGYEGVELHVEEIDQALVPVEYLENVPDALRFETMLVYDPKGNDWLGAIALYPVTKEWLMQVILKNGHSLYRRKVTDNEEIDEATGFFESEIMSEEELVELLLDEAIISEVEVNFEKSSVAYSLFLMLDPGKSLKITWTILKNWFLYWNNLTTEVVGSQSLCQTQF